MIALQRQVSDSLVSVRALLFSLALVLTLVGSASASTIASRTELLLTVKHLPPDFRVAKPGRDVSARAERQSYGVNTARFGRVSGVHVSFKRPVTDFTDRALNQVDIGLIFFRSAGRAHRAYEALVAKERRLFAVHVGAESVGSGLSGPDVNVRWVWWRHKNVVANMTGSYFYGHPNVRSLVELAQAQQSRLARSVR
jgi:hypothetical protein